MSFWISSFIQKKAYTHLPDLRMAGVGGVDEEYLSDEQFSLVRSERSVGHSPLEQLIPKPSNKSRIDSYTSPSRHRGSVCTHPGN